MNPIPSAFAIGEVYLPPLLVVTWLGLAAATLTAHLLNRFRLPRSFFYPPLVLLALTALYIVGIGTWIIPLCASCSVTFSPPP
jgi:hypothetical protein